MKNIKTTLLITTSSVVTFGFGSQIASADTTVSVNSGQTLSSIASDNNVSIDDLVKANNLQNRNLIFVGQKLTVPDGKTATSTPTVSSTPTNNASEYTVVSNDTLWQIASKNNMSVNELKTLNNLTSDLIYVGQKLKINTDFSDVKNEQVQTEFTATQNSTSKSYVIQSGDTLNKISQKLGVSVNKLVQLNNLTNQNIISVGQTLKTGDNAQSDEQTQNTNSTATPQTNNANEQGVGIKQSDASWYNLATSFIGVPYVWGGKTPAGFDCSGFVAYVLNHSGRTTDFPAYTVSAESRVNQISVSNAKPGDLLFWGDKGATYHIAIYLGNNQFIDAPQPGSSVSIETLSPYWMPSFAGQIN